MQLVVSGNRILAHGEGFLAMGGTVINTDTGRVYQNATVVECDGCPSDIDKVGYEYHAGQFVPCAPFGVGDGNLAVVCGEDCKSLKDSGIPAGVLTAEKVREICQNNARFNGFLGDLGLAEVWSLIRAADVKIETGTYEGTGVWGENNPNTLTFSIVPQVVFLDNKCILCRDGSYMQHETPTSGSTGSTVWGDHSVSWYASTRYSGGSSTGLFDDDAYLQMNKSGATYRYIAIGM